MADDAAARMIGLSMSQTMAISSARAATQALDSDLEAVSAQIDRLEGSLATLEDRRATLQARFVAGIEGELGLAPGRLPSEILALAVAMDDNGETSVLTVPALEPAGEGDTLELTAEEREGLDMGADAADAFGLEVEAGAAHA